MNDYITGFQDAIELCLQLSDKARDKEELKVKLQETLRLTVASKLDRIKCELSGVKQVIGEIHE